MIDTNGGVPTKHDLRIGVIGVGGRGGLANYAHKPGRGSYLIAGADVNPKALQEFRERVGQEARVYEDYRQLLAADDIDAVFITSPDYCHEEHAVAALEAGKAIYLEKPMAITIEGCDRILETARRTEGLLYVGHNLRHAPFAVTMKSLIDQGAIGQVKAIWCRHFISYGGEAYFKDWHAQRELSTGLLLQKGAHDIDIIHWLGGGYTQRVHAMGGLTLYGDIKDRRSPDEPPMIRSVPDLWPPTAQTGLNPVIDVEDLSHVQMQLDNGVLASYVQCHYTPDAWRNYTVIGTKGRIENFGDYAGDVVVRLWNSAPDYRSRGDREYPIESDQKNHGGADPNIVDEFVRVVRDGDSASLTPLDARYSVATGCCATQSLREQSQAIDVPGVSEACEAYFEKYCDGERVTA